LIAIHTLLRRALLALAVVLAFIYLADSISVHYRLTAHRQGDPLDVITYPRLLAIPQKGNRVEYILDQVTPTESDACVHAWFPHLGVPPCWYIARKAKTPIPMTIFFFTRYLQ
jgi:hypothetical protein